MYSIYRRRVATHRKRTNVNKRASWTHCSAERVVGRSGPAGRKRLPRATRLPVYRRVTASVTQPSRAFFFLLAPTTTNRCSSSTAGGGRLDPATDTRNPMERPEACCSRFAYSSTMAAGRATRPPTSRRAVKTREENYEKTPSTTTLERDAHYMCRAKSVRPRSAQKPPPPDYFRQVITIMVSSDTAGFVIKCFSIPRRTRLLAR